MRAGSTTTIFSDGYVKVVYLFYILPLSASRPESLSVDNPYKTIIIFIPVWWVIDEFRIKKKTF